MTKDSSPPPNWDTPSTVTSMDRAYPSGTRIGPYKILSVLGEGGFGVVYLAEQTTPVRRRVALKVIKPGMDSRAVIARFEAERQALAMMDHPNVAKVFDAGTTEQGRPYFVMEHVPGVPVTEHCDRHRLSIDERLELFMQICEAVQHAHQKGIIHRDIKPKNILVSIRDGEPAPKVIDFGVAKAISQPLTEKTLFTEEGQLIGTPAYMSPEQAERTAQDIDTRSDIYSLGVLLYELLAGALPFDPLWLRSAAYEEMLRIIREVEPPRPSTRLSSLTAAKPSAAPSRNEPVPATARIDYPPGSGSSVQEIARNRRTEPSSLNKLLRGDLDWITMRAMEKDRTRRYASATDLASDIRRHLHHEPVVASPPSAAYRLRKFMRRNRGLVTAATAVFAVLVAGIAGTTWQAVVATDQRARVTEALVEAKKEAAKARRIQTFLQRMLESVDPWSRIASNPNVTVREILDAAAERIDSELRGQPETLGALRATIGTCYKNLAMPERAEPHLRAALSTLQSIYGDVHPDVAGVHSTLALLVRNKGEYETAGKLFRDSLNTYRELYGTDHSKVVTALLRLCWVRREQGHGNEAEELAREALEISRRMHSSDHKDIAEALNSLGQVLLWKFDHEGAEALFQEALPLYRKILGRDHPDTAACLSNMAVAYALKGDYSESEKLNREVLALYENRLPATHHYVLTGLFVLATNLQDQGKLDQAETYNRQALDVRRRVLGDDHPDTLFSIRNTGGLLNQLKRHREALELLRGGKAAALRVWSGNARNLGNYLAKLGEAEGGVGEFSAGESTLLEAHGLLAEGFGDDHERTIKCIERLIALYDAWHAAEPDAGHDAQAAEWRAKLPPQPTTQPAE